MIRPGVVIVEGPDGSGKSTLVRYLTEQLGGLSMHSGVPSGDPLAEYLNAMARFMAEGRLFVVDRFHIGEQVYGPIMRDGDRLGLCGRRIVESALMTFFRPVVIICQPSFHTCHRNWLLNHANEYVKDTPAYYDVWHAFMQVATELPVLKYDFTRDDVTRLLEEVRHAVLDSE